MAFDRRAAETPALRAVSELSIAAFHLTEASGCVPRWYRPTRVSGGRVPVSALCTPSLNLPDLGEHRLVPSPPSFPTAAHKLNTTQSNVSLRVAEVERELGFALVDSTTRRARATVKGRDLLRHVAQIALLMDEVRNPVGDAHTISGSARINAAEIVARRGACGSSRASGRKGPSLSV